MSQTTAQLIGDLVQPLGHADGTEGAPTLSFKDDEDTGLFRPGDNTLGLATGGSTRLTIDSSGRLLVGMSSSSGQNAGLQIASATGQYDSRNAELFRFDATNDTSGPTLYLTRSKSDTIGTIAAVNADDGLGEVRFAGAGDASTYLNGASIRAFVDTGTVSSTSMPTYLALATTADGASSPTERMRISANGQVRIQAEGTELLRITQAVDAATQQEYGIGFASNPDHTNPGAQITFEEFDASDSRGGLLFYTRNSNSDATPTERMRISANGNITVDTDTFFVDAVNGRVGIGTTTPTSYANSQTTLVIEDDTNPAICWSDTGQTRDWWAVALGSALSFRYADGGGSGSATNVTNVLHLDNGGSVGIGTTSPNTTLNVVGTSDGVLNLDTTDTRGSFIRFAENGTNKVWVGCAEGMITGTDQDDLGLRATDNIVFRAGTSENARIDSSGRLLVGTTSYTGNATILAQGHSGSSSGPAHVLIKRGDNSVGADTDLGYLFFSDSNSSGGFSSWIRGMSDGGTWTSGSSLPGKLIFATTANGASSPTERIRIHSGGQVTVGSSADTTPWNNTSGASTVFNATNVRAGLMAASAQDGDVLALNRMGSDGAIIIFYGQGSSEGSIDVNGTTISLTGGHLARWSQFSGIGQTDITERPEILRGSVMSNLDELCSWKKVVFDVTVTDQNGEETTVSKSLPYAGTADAGDTIEYEYEGNTYTATVGTEENEQLNKMQVSSLEGDIDVAGVFQAWDDDDDTIVNDFYCAMTGDFVIRIAQGTTVARGDLLMSAGDGTAKPQDDDIVRSKTIAKVTSTNVSCTYDDGSYCVPCVLMAC